jgi:hypothetical protein
MKFEKFIKRAGINAVIVTDPDGRKWIYNDGVAMIIPPCFVDNYGDAAYKIPADIFGAINDIDPDVTNPAELIRAEIPADGKAKEITRIYADGDFEFAVHNADWSLIERNDSTFIAIDDNDETAALAIYLGENIRGVIFPIGFSIDDLDKIN